ncbi:hypothetical protein L7F22_067189 [Adiantum nelumboides]|nr:hypothetical protein [Adiantum nelumboides]
MPGDYNSPLMRTEDLQPPHLLAADFFQNGLYSWASPHAPVNTYGNLRETDEVILDMFFFALEKSPFVYTKHQSSATLPMPLVDANTLESNNEPSMSAMPVAPSYRPAYNNAKDDGDDSFDAAKITDVTLPLSMALELAGKSAGRMFT